MKYIRKLLFITILIVSMTGNSKIGNTNDMVCLVVVCLEGQQSEQNGGGGCIDPMSNYYSIVKKTGSLVKKVSCPLTKEARKQYLSQCKEYTGDLEKIVDCETK